MNDPPTLPPEQEPDPPVEQTDDGQANLPPLEPVAAAPDYPQEAFAQFTQDPKRPEQQPDDIEEDIPPPPKELTGTPTDGPEGPQEPIEELSPLPEPTASEGEPDVVEPPDLDTGGDLPIAPPMPPEATPEPPPPRPAKQSGLATPEERREAIHDRGRKRREERRARLGKAPQPFESHGRETTLPEQEKPNIAPQQPEGAPQAQQDDRVNELILAELQTISGILRDLPDKINTGAV